MRRYGVAVSVDPKDATTDNHDGRRDPLADLLRALSSVDPADVLTRGAQTVDKLVAAADLAVESLNNVNTAAKRLNSILDDIEEPLRHLLPHVSTTLANLSKMSDAASTLNELAKKLGPLSGFLQPSKPPTAE